MSPWLGCRLSGFKIQIAFLGETKRTIPRSRPAPGRASRAGLVQDAACGTGAQRRLLLDETEHGAMLVQVGPPASSKTATPNHPAIEMNSSSVTVRRRGVGLRCRPIGQQRSCLRRSVESADGASLPRDFVPWRFSDAGLRACGRTRHRRRPKTCTRADLAIEAHEVRNGSRLCETRKLPENGASEANFFASPNL